MWQTVGQDRAVAALQRALAGGRRAHAYLLAGPPQVGKATLARELAQALNCEGADPPCHECTPCRRIAAGIHADVQTVTVEAADEGPARKNISINQIRNPEGDPTRWTVQRAVSLRPFEGRCRVIIFDPADAMSREAQNAFLKTLEEPPPEVVFVLVTALPQVLLPTTRSRCQRLDLRPLPVAAAQAALVERWGVPERRAELLARLSRGRLGWALAAQADEEMLRARRETLMDIRNLARRSLADRFACAGDLAGRFGRQREAVLDVLELWGQWWRDVLLAASGCHEAITNVDLSDILRAEAARYDPRQVAAFLRSLAAARRRLEENVNPRLALEVLLLDLPAAAG